MIHICCICFLVSLKIITITIQYNRLCVQAKQFSHSYHGGRFQHLRLHINFISLKSLQTDVAVFSPKYFHVLKSCFACFTLHILHYFQTYWGEYLLTLSFLGLSNEDIFIVCYIFESSEVVIPNPADDWNYEWTKAPNDLYGDVYYIVKFAVMYFYGRREGWNYKSRTPIQDKSNEIMAHCATKKIFLNTKTSICEPDYYCAEICFPVNFSGDLKTERWECIGC
jgi:hypothetical protein